MQGLTTLIADDHGMIRDGLREMLTRAAAARGLRIDLVGEAANGVEAMTLLRRHRPELAVLDVSMPLAGGTEVLIELRRWAPKTRVIVVTGIEMQGKIREIMALGVDGLLYKGEDSSMLEAALAQVLGGRTVVSEHYRQMLEIPAAQVSFTPRERQVLHQIVMGRSNREIAEALTISPHTVDRHRTNLMAKAGARNAAALVAFAQREGLIAEAGRDDYASTQSADGAEEV